MSIGSESYAFPLGILSQHEIVNFRDGVSRYSITYCPLTSTSLVFNTNNVGELGVSGLLYNSNLIMYDRRTDELWSQMLGQKVHGSNLCENLSLIHSISTTWETWKRLYPNSNVLSNQTGFDRTYPKTIKSFNYKNIETYFSCQTTHR